MKTLIALLNQFVILTVFLCFSSGLVYAKNWELVYEHDASGMRVSGDINDLYKAIRQGADVKPLANNGLGNANYSIAHQVFMVPTGVEESAATVNNPSHVVHAKIITYPLEGSDDGNLGHHQIISGLKRIWLLRSDGISERIDYDISDYDDVPPALPVRKTVNLGLQWFVNK